MGLIFILHNCKEPFSLKRNYKVVLTFGIFLLVSCVCQSYVNGANAEGKCLKGETRWNCTNSSWK